MSDHQAYMQPLVFNGAMSYLTAKTHVSASLANNVRLAMTHYASLAVLSGRAQRILTSRLLHLTMLKPSKLAVNQTPDASTP